MWGGANLSSRKKTIWLLLAIIGLVMLVFQIQLISAKARVRLNTLPDCPDFILGHPTTIHFAGICSNFVTVRVTVDDYDSAFGGEDFANQMQEITRTIAASLETEISRSPASVRVRFQDSGQPISVGIEFFSYRHMTYYDSFWYENGTFGHNKYPRT